MHMAIWEQEEIAMNLDKKAQIEVQIKAQSGAQSRAQSEVQIRALIFNEAPIEVLAEYANYSNVFLAENVTELPKKHWDEWARYRDRKK